MLGPRWIRRRGIEKSKKETHFTLPHTRVQVIADRHGRGIGAVIRLLGPRWIRRRGIEKQKETHSKLHTPVFRSQPIATGE